MRSKSRICFFLVLACIVFACSKVPGGILSEREMKSVLMDMRLAEAMVETNYKDFGTIEKKEALYASVFKKHKITQAYYDSSLVWYGRNLDIYMRVNDAVQAELKKQKDALGNIQPDDAPALNRDSLNIWTRRDFLVLQKNTAGQNGVFFDFKPSGGYTSGSQFVMSMNVFGLNSTMSHYPVVYLNAQMADTIISAKRDITKDGFVELVVKGLATKKVQRVYGYITLDNKDNNYHKIYVDSIRLMKYNYGTELGLTDPYAIEMIRKVLVSNDTTDVKPVGGSTPK